MGFIRGGNCDRLHRERFARECAVEGIANVLLLEGAIIPSGKGKYKVGKLPRSFGVIAMAFARGSADREIAFWRVVQALLPQLRKQKKPFTLKRFNTLAKDIQKFTFIIGGSLDPIKIVGALNQPHYPKMYEKRKAAGHFGNEREGMCGV